LIPKVSSEKRNYIPVGFVSSGIIASGSALVFPGATHYDFGILSSAIHMAWVKQVCGRMKSDYQYSSQLVYNNYPWPVDATAGRKQAVEAAANAVLEVREKCQQDGSTLADLYGPLSMPADLLKEHEALDRAVDKCYRAKKFETERERVEYLFALYEKLTVPPIPQPKKKRARRMPKSDLKRKEG